MTFKEYLDREKLTPYKFAKKSYIAFNTIKKLYSGGCVRIDVAKRLHRITGKEVPIEKMVSCGSN